MVKYDLEQMKKKNPEWLRMLLRTRFFGPCIEHREFGKNKKKVFCIDCERCICQHCLSTSHHLNHKMLQVRRYVYHDVIKLHDLQKLFDCSKVQPYTINGAKAVFLNPRPQSSRPSVKSNFGFLCKICERNLTDPNQYCSIACKVSDAVDDVKEWSRSFLMCEDSFPFPEFCSEPISKVGESSNSHGLTESGNSPGSPGSSYETGSWLGFPVSNPKPRKRKGVPRRSPVC